LLLGVARGGSRGIAKAFLAVLVDFAINLGNYGTMKRQTALVGAGFAKQRGEAEAQQHGNEEFAELCVQEAFEMHIHRVGHFLGLRHRLGNLAFVCGALHFFFLKAKACVGLVTVQNEVDIFGRGIDVNFALLVIQRRVDDKHAYRKTDQKHVNVDVLAQHI